MNGLEILSKDLATKMNRATDDVRRKASLTAVEFAISKSQLDHPLVAKLLDKLQTHQSISPSEETELRELAETLDAQYLDLQEAIENGRGDEDQYVRRFAEARTAFALMFAWNKNPFMAATESIYEAAAILASEDKSELLGLIETILDQ